MFAARCRLALMLALTCAAACSDDDKGKETGSNPATDDASVSDASSSDDVDAAKGSSAFSDDQLLPIVFVHGFAGSAQQFQSQAMRFEMNGYPADHLLAFEHDGAGAVTDAFITGLDSFVDDARSKFSTDKVYLIGHSRGTSVSSMYLSDATRAGKVARYISLDGAGCADIPVPCAAPAQTTNMRGTQTDPIPGQKHVEIATSKESFAIQFKFLFGREPEKVDIVKQTEPVVISGRAVNFPANTGRDGSTFQLWELESATGHRTGDTPKITFQLDSSGNWGPVTVDPNKHYEMTLVTKDSPFQHHFYTQPFIRSSQFVRLLSGPPDSDSRTHTNTGDGHSAIVLMRMREWTTDDEVSVKTETTEASNVITPEITNNPISIFLHDDAATPGKTSLALLPWFPMQPFQTGVDVFMPANADASGTITLTNLPRGAKDKPQTIRAANWPSTNQTITVMFNDYPQD